MPRIGSARRADRATHAARAPRLFFGFAADSSLAAYRRDYDEERARRAAHGRFRALQYYFAFQVPRHDR